MFQHEASNLSINEQISLNLPLSHCPLKELRYLSGGAPMY